MRKILKLIKKPLDLLESYIIQLGDRAENFNNRELVKHYLLKGYTTEEIASATPMELCEVASHVRYWKGYQHGR